MRRANVFVNGVLAGDLIEHSATQYEFVYFKSYSGNPVSLTLKIQAEPYKFNSFPAFFEGLLPEGLQKDALLRQRKIDKNDFFSQLIAVGEDMVGAVTVREAE